MSPRQFGRLITALRREGADPVRRGRPWSLPLQDRVLLVAAYWRTNLTLRRLAPHGGYRGTGLTIPHHRRYKDEDLPAWKEDHNASHRKVHARVEHTFARMKTWKIPRGCRLRGDGVHHAMLGIARPYNLTLAGWQANKQVNWHAPEHLRGTVQCCDRDGSP
nr:hypothetical protein [Streptomyces taklimakanensis]